MDTKTLIRWQQILADQSSSGKSITAYCREHRLSTGSFYKYRSILQRLGITGSTTAEEIADSVEENTPAEQAPVPAEEDPTDTDVSEESDPVTENVSAEWDHTVCLVDTENVGKDWPTFILNNPGISTFVLFYTVASTGISVPDFMILMRSGIDIEAISCYTGRNALDFQLVTYLGSLTSLHPEWSFCILSNDTGYDSVVKFWKDRGVNIARCKVRDKIALSKKKAEEAVTVPAEPAHEEKAGHDQEGADTKTTEKEITEMLLKNGCSVEDMESGELGGIASIVAESAKTPKNNRKNEIYLKFMSKYGKNGQDLYIKYKKSISTVLAELDAKKQSKS